MDVRQGEVRTPRLLGGAKKTPRPGQSERMRGLSSANGPINTLDGPPMANSRRQPRPTFSSTDSALGGGSKRRQDYDREPSNGNRTSKRLRLDPGPSSDAVRLSSQGDTNDAESIGNSPASNDGRRSKKKECTNRLRQEEFRSTAMGSPSSRRRRRQKKTPSGPMERRGSEDARRNSGLSKSMSPDELQNSSPPPVVSDLLPQKSSALAKPSRPAQANTRPGPFPFEAAKHRRKNVQQLEEISDDELANDGRKQKGGSKPQPSSNSTKCRSARLGPTMRLRQAVSGTHIFQPEDDIELARNDSGSAWMLVTVDGKSIRYPWLQLDVGRMNKLDYSLESEIVVVHRPTAKTVPSMLSLKFEHEKASRQFVREVGEASGTVRFVPKSVDALTNIYERGLDIARQSCSREHADTPTSADDPESASFADTSPPSDRKARRNQDTGERQASNSRLVDRLSARGTGRCSVSPPPSEPPAMPRARRTTRQSASGVDLADEHHFVPRWSLDNTAWKKDWDRELVYPSTGRNRATVHKEDIQRLDEGAFLNDSLVFCYLRYLQEEMERERPEIATRIYFMNTYFFEILRKAKGWLINYEGVKSWTSRVDIFSYDYIVVPVNEEAHWYLAIICNPRVVIEGSQDADDDVVCLDSGEEVRRDPPASPRTQRKHEPGSPSSPISPAKNHASREKEQSGTARGSDSKDFRIITLDSLGAPHSKTCQMLRKYLVEEAKARKNIDPMELDKKIGLTAKNIPAQANFCDCGVFLLGYAQRFLEDPDGFIATILQRGKPEWTVDASQLRNQIRETLFRLHKTYREELAANRKLKKRKKVKGGTQESLSTASNSPVSEAQDGAGSAPDQPDPPSNLQLTGGGDTPSSTPAREQTSGGRSVEPGSVNQQAEGRTSPRTSPPSTVFVAKSKAMASPQGKAQSENGCDTPDTGQDAKRWEEEAKIRQSIEHDGGQSPSTSSHNTGPSPNPSSARGQPDLTDDMVHSSQARSPPDTRTYETPASPAAPLRQSIEKPNRFASEPRFIGKLRSSPMSAKSSRSPVLGDTPPRKRDDAVFEIQDDDEAPRASERVKETGTTSHHFEAGADGKFSFIRRSKYDSRTFEVPGKGQERGPNDTIDLTGKE